MTKIIRIQNMELIAATIMLLVLSSCVAHAQARLTIDYNDARRILKIDDVSTVINHTTNYWAIISDSQIRQINNYRKVARRHRSTPIEVITINSLNTGYFFDLLNLLQTELEDAGVEPTLGHVYACYKLGEQFKALNYDLNYLPEPLRRKVKVINDGLKSIPSIPPIPDSFEKNPIIAPETSDIVGYNHQTEAYRWTTRPPSMQSTNTLPYSVYGGLQEPETPLEEKLTIVSSYSKGQILKVDKSSEGIKISIDSTVVNSYLSLVALYGRLLPNYRLIGEQDSLGIAVEGESFTIKEAAFHDFYTMIRAKERGTDPVDPRYPKKIYVYYNTPDDPTYAMDAVYRNLYNSLIEIYGGQYGLVCDQGIGVGYKVDERSTFTLEATLFRKFMAMNENRLSCATPSILSTSTAITRANSSYDIGKPTTYASLQPAPYSPDSSLDPDYNKLYSE